VLNGQIILYSSQHSSFMALAIFSTQFTLTEPSMRSLALILAGVNLAKIQTKFEFLEKKHGTIVS